MNDLNASDFDIDGSLAQNRGLHQAAKKAESVKEACADAREHLADKGASFLETCYSTDEKVQALQEFSEVRERVLKRYGVELVISSELGFSKYQTLPLLSLVKARDLALDLEKQMNKLPLDFFKRIKINKFVLIKKAFVYSDRFQINRIAANVDACEEGDINFVMSFPLYHEMYHRIDGIRGGLQKKGDYFEVDFETGKIIAEECHTNEVLDNGGLWSGQEKRPPDEWQAEVCMILFRQNDIDKERFQRWMKEPGGPERFDYIKRVLKEVDPRLNEKYWEDLRNGKVNQDYWDSR